MTLLDFDGPAHIPSVQVFLSLVIVSFISKVIEYQIRGMNYKVCILSRNESLLIA